jgi:hypothetical protein
MPVSRGNPKNKAGEQPQADVGFIPESLKEEKRMFLRM